MAILFSKVTLSSGDKTASFLVSGAPASEHSLDGWTNYHSFVRSLNPHSHVVASVTEYLYGEEDIFDATPEEVAYMTMRLQMRPDFLEKRCDQIDQTEFSFST